MTEYRNIDDVIEDAQICVTIGDLKKTPLDISGIPKISDEISLDSDKADSMVIEVTEVSDDNSLLKGRVVHGYFPENQNEWINEGEFVEVSRKKISGIFKNGSD